MMTSSPDAMLCAAPVFATVFVEAAVALAVAAVMVVGNGGNIHINEHPCSRFSLCTFFLSSSFLTVKTHTPILSPSPSSLAPPFPLNMKISTLLSLSSIFFIAHARQQQQLETDVRQSASDLTIYEGIQRNPNLAVFRPLAPAANLDNRLGDPSRQSTLFAPTNGAFRRLARQLTGQTGNTPKQIVDILTPLLSQLATIAAGNPAIPSPVDVLNYHVLPRGVRLIDLRNSFFRTVTDFNGADGSSVKLGFSKV